MVDVCKPLTESSVYQGAVELSDNPKCGYWISKEILLCALKGLQKELEGFIDDYPVEPAEYDFGRRTAYVSALARLKIWFPILQSETLKTTDDGNAHLPQSNQTEDVRTSESLVGGSEQTSTYTCLCTDWWFDGKFWNKRTCKKHHVSSSQPSVQVGDTGQKGNCLSSGASNSVSEDKSQCGDAGELKTVRNLLTLQTERILEQKDAPRKGTR